MSENMFFCSYVGNRSGYILGADYTDSADKLKEIREFRVIRA